MRELVKDDAWLDGEFISTVQQRGAAIIKQRNLSSALSAASSACDHIRNWVLGTPEVRPCTLPQLTAFEEGQSAVFPFQQAWSL